MRPGSPSTRMNSARMNFLRGPRLWPSILEPGLPKGRESPLMSQRDGTGSVPRRRGHGQRRGWQSLHFHPSRIRSNPAGRNELPRGCWRPSSFTGDDLKASNSFQSPQRVSPQPPGPALLADSRAGAGGARALRPRPRTGSLTRMNRNLEAGAMTRRQSFRGALVRKANRFSSPSSLTSESSPGSDAYLAALFEGSAAQCRGPFAGGLAPIG